MLSVARFGRVCRGRWEAEDPASSTGGHLQLGSSCPASPAGTSCLCSACCEAVQISPQVTQFWASPVRDFTGLCPANRGLHFCSRGSPGPAARVNLNLCPTPGFWEPQGRSVCGCLQWPFTRDSPSAPCQVAGGEHRLLRVPPNRDL